MNFAAVYFLADVRALTNSVDDGPSPTQNVLNTILMVLTIVAATSLVVGAKRLSGSRPRGGVWFAAGAMLIIAATALWTLNSYQKPLLFGGVLAALALGAIVGLVIGLRARISDIATQLPPVMCVLNALAGLAAILVGGAFIAAVNFPTLPALFAALVCGVCGGLAFGGSVVAYPAIQGRPRLQWLAMLPGLKVIRMALSLTVLVSIQSLVMQSQQSERLELYQFIYLVPVAASITLGILWVGPYQHGRWIAVVATLAMAAGFATAAAGFLQDQLPIIVAGGLAAGIASGAGKALVKAGAAGITPHSD